MKAYVLIITAAVLLCMQYACKKDGMEVSSSLQELKSTKYFDAEVFAQSDLKIYGMWKLYDVSGGFSGSGHDLNFDYLEIKPYAIYGFIRRDSLIEYGKVVPAQQSGNDLRLKIDFEKDEKSGEFFNDREKYVEFNGNDTLHLNSPCCDRYNYHFIRIQKH